MVRPIIKLAAKPIEPNQPTIKQMRSHLAKNKLNSNINLIGKLVSDMIVTTIFHNIFCVLQTRIYTQQGP